LSAFLAGPKQYALFGWLIRRWI